MVVVGSNGLSWFSHFGVTEVWQGNPQTVVCKFEEYCKLYENALQEIKVLIRRTNL